MDDGSGRVPATELLRLAVGRIPCRNLTEAEHDVDKLINYVKNLDYREVNDKLRETDGACTLSGCLGQRFIAAGMADREITIEGTPGNALGAYLNGADITVRGNAQDAVGDTMNAGRIVVHGNIGDAAGYAMRGGRIFVRDDAGYRAGIHMKAYREKVPVMVIGGRCGSFLGEYQAGGVIVVLGLTHGESALAEGASEKQKPSDSFARTSLMCSSRAANVQTSSN